MRKLAIFTILAALWGSVSAQSLGRSEFSLYDAREDALKRDHSKTVNHILFAPKAMGELGDIEMVGMEIDVPASWNDYNAYLHLENCRSGFDVAINGKVVASSEDPHTPQDFFISPYLVQGSNKVVLILRPSSCAELNAGAKFSNSPRFDGCYIYAQNRSCIYDYDVAIVVGEDKKLHLELDLIAGNDFNYEETITLGYDIYTPENKLVDYAVRDVIVGGRSRDTLEVRVDLGAELRYLWSAAKPQLYRMTLYVKRNGKPTEYVPLYVGAGETTFADGAILRNSKPITIKSAAYNAAATMAATRKEIVALRSKGINTLMPDSPQPVWFYELCDKIGMYIIEQASINPTEGGDNRAVGGTPSNNPQLVEHYLERVKSMYYRTRNHASIIAYSLGSKSAGNGYCMYKAYQWLKSVEKQRPVICYSADGEWNTDM